MQVDVNCCCVCCGNEDNFRLQRDAVDRGAIDVHDAARL
jgi:hypothetical protein